MDDFREYVNQEKGNNTQNVFDTVRNLANKFDGKSTNDLLKVIYEEALKGKKNGTLTNADIDGFAFAIAPFLDDKKRKYLKKIVDELKKI